MNLINVSAQAFVPGRRKRNEAWFHHLVHDGAFDAGVFVNRPRNAPPWHVLSVELLVDETVGPKRALVIEALVPHAPGSDAQATRAAAETVRWLDDRGLVDDHVLLVNFVSAYSFELAKALAPRARRIIFDISDHFASWAWPEGQAVVEDRIRQLLGMADRVTVINDYLLARYPHRNGRVFANGTDFDNFQRDDRGFTLAPHFPKPPGVVYIGFIGGVIRERVDMTLMQRLFEYFPSWHFAFVGYANDRRVVEQLTRNPRAFFVPEVPYEQLGSVIKTFDVAIVPHVTTEFTEGNDLLKVIDYMASGVPVVSTPCSNVGRFAGVIEIAEDPERFAAALERAVRERGRFDPRPGIAVARALSWKPRLLELQPWLLD